MTSTYRKVVLTSGHMIDAPDRETPRFPAALEPVVAFHIERVFDEWEIGSGDLVLNGGARGADILFAESADRRMADVEIILASAPDTFEETSVSLPQSVWQQRFRHLLRRHPHRVAEPGDEDPFAHVNAELFRRAEELMPAASLHIALVWDEQPAGGPGGTGEFADLARRFNAPLAIINPTTL